MDEQTNHDVRRAIMDTIEPRLRERVRSNVAPRTLLLEDFLPYRLSVLSGAVSRVLSRLCERRFGISVGEWRVIANLARFGPLSANGVCERSAMDKVQVSRAVAKAVENGLIDRAIDPYDRRRSVLTLTDKGKRVHDQIVPLAQEFQEHLRGELTREESDHLNELLSRLMVRACSPRFVEG